MKPTLWAAALILALTGCTPTTIPVVDTILAADLSPLTFIQESKGCQPMELFCSNPLFEPAFKAPASASPKEVCDKVVDLQARIGIGAYSATGAPAGKVSDIQEVKDFCAAGLELGGDDGQGSPFYEGTTLYDDGSKDGVGKVTVINRETSGYTVVFSVSRNLQRAGGWISYGSKPVHLNSK